MTFLRHSSRRFMALGLAFFTAAALAASPAAAHEGPATGTRCAINGMAVTDHHGTYVCQSRGTGKPRWGKVLPVSTSPLTMKDGWTKAADTGMTAAFGTLQNPTGQPIRVIAAFTPYSPTQLHEVTEKDGAMVMQQKPGGFVIPAKGSLQLQPGGNHVMLVKLSKPIRAGAMVPVTFVTSDGGLLKTTLMAKVFTGANETYEANSNMSGMG